MVRDWFFRNTSRGIGATHHILWLIVCIAAMQLDATSMESNPIAAHPENLRTEAGSLFRPSSAVLKSNRFQTEANACFKNNKYKEAIDLFAQAIECNPV